MPKVELSRRDLLSLAGMNDIPDELLEEKLSALKAELDYSDGDFLKIELNDTNRPDLWCLEGIARGLRCMEKGSELHLADLPSPAGEIRVDAGLLSVRPFIAGFTAHGWAPDEDALEALITVQEKLATSFGRKRKTAAIGFYRLSEISFPIRYRAAGSECSFVPLGEEREFSLEEVLSDTETGKTYAHLLADSSTYPVLEDSAGSILSFPPIINSQSTGRLQPGDSDIFCEVTGTDWHTVQLTATILACNMQDRGAVIEPIRIVYGFELPCGGSEVTTPLAYGDMLSVRKSEINRILGRLPGDDEIVHCLERMDYASCSVEKGVVEGVLPPYRHDGIHGRDLIEDIAIGMGLSAFEPELPLEFTVGRSAPIEDLCDEARLILIGAGCEEILRPVLGSREKIVDRSATPGTLLEIRNPMTAEFGVVRNSLLPGLLEVESASAHAAYPHRIFEVGEVLVSGRDGFCRTAMLLGVLICWNEADFGDAHSILGALCHARGLDLELKPALDNRFIPGRAASVLVDGKDCGVIGEYHPSILTGWGIGRPASGFEIGIDDLKG